MKHLVFLLFSTASLSATHVYTYQLEDGIAKEYLQGETWALHDEERVYYSLDNQTIASFDQVVDDPFLVIRTKCTPVEEPYNLLSSWHNYTRFSPFQMNRLDSEENSSSASALQTPTPPSAEVVFDFETPHFPIACPADAEAIWWQISSTPLFSLTVPNCERIEPATESITLDPMAETFFNPGECYHFRYCIRQQGKWGSWSPACSFTFLRPKSIQDVAFKKVGGNKFQIRWEEPDDPDVRFWVFASNALDFVPSIYSPIQLNAALEDQVLAEEANENLIATLSTPTLEIDGSYAYYRVIAEKNGCFSTPSPLIRVYDDQMTHERTVLQRVASPMEGYAQRIVFPQDCAPCSSKALTFQANVKPAVVNDAVWEAVSPYLMPLNHPIRGQLDRLFGSARVLLDANTLTRAGFTNTKPGLFSKAIIAEHPKMKGYFFKMFSDSQPNLIDWEQWVRRCYGAASAKASINNLGLRDHFVVPKKWIYPLPAHPAPPPGYSQKFFICVAEKIKLYEKKKSYAKWKSMPRERLKAIVRLLQAEGLTDSIRAFNLPFAKDGRNALIDLEHNHNWPVHFSAMKKWLSSQNCTYLDQLEAQYAH